MSAKAAFEYADYYYIEAFLRLKKLNEGMAAADPVLPEPMQSDKVVLCQVLYQ